MTIINGYDFTDNPPTALEKKLGDLAVRMVTETTNMVEIYVGVVNITDNIYQTGYVSRRPKDETKQANDLAAISAEINAGVVACVGVQQGLPTIAASAFTERVLAINEETAHITVSDFNAMLDALLGIHVMFQAMQAPIRRGATAI